jgi:membrane-associated protease RseP (regulator of RpoE activity)
MTDDETPTTDETPSADDATEASAGSDDDTTPPEGADADATLPETEAAAPAAPVATTAAPAAASTEERAGVFVPRWAAILVGALVALLVVGGVGFALGRATDDDHDEGRGAVIFGPGGQQIPGRGDDGGGRTFPVPNPGGGDGSGPAVPGIPEVPRGGVLLGVAVEPATGDTSGARVAQVVPGSPAAHAGLEVGDVITKVDDTTISDGGELVSTIRSHESGDKVTITYERDGESHSTDVTLGSEGSSSANGSGSQESSTTD